MSDKQLHTFNGMEFVRTEYAGSGLTDTEFAKFATEKLGAPYSLAQIRNYRTTWKLPANEPKDLREQLVKARELIARVVQHYDVEDGHLPVGVFSDLKEFLEK